MSLLILLGTAFFFGLRHGIDWDHIAAIMSITGTTKKEKQLVSNFLYITGHAIVIIILGMCAILLGVTLPSWVDTVMEPIVGITLIILGMYLIISLMLPEKKFKPMSRWMLVYHCYQGVVSYVKKFFHPHEKKESIRKEQGLRNAFFIGVIHGIGAETPTQVLLFLTIAGVSGKGVALILLIAFILGLLLSHSLISFATVYGFKHIQKHDRLFKIIGFISAILSLCIGILFLFQQGTLLPPLS
ncbi:MAG: cytochrome c biogenesis protein CcdA [Patescibacteria group bacterium]